MKRRKSGKSGGKSSLSVKEELAAQRQRDEDRLTEIGVTIGKKRDDAVSARKTSGVERIWKEDEEYYLGIDDLNRSKSAYTKPAGLDGGLTESTPTGQDEVGECTAFFNITRQFVDSAAARMGDILLPAGDWNFSIKPTPIADIETIKGSDQPVVDQSGMEMTKPDGSAHTLGEFAEKEQGEAAKAVEKGERRIRDYLTECRLHAEERRVIEDSAKLGTGVLRGPYPVKQKAKAVVDGDFVISEKIVPASKRVSPWNFFPDPNCGDDIHNGSFCLERDYMSARQLRGLIGVPGYKSEQITKVLKEGPKGGDAEVEGKARNDDRFEVWYYYGDMEADDLRLCGCDLGDDDDEDDSVKNPVAAVAVLVNDTVIKAYMNPISSGDFPYDVFPWQRVFDSWVGVGIARQGRIAQDTINAAARTLMKNTGLSHAPQVIIREGVVYAADGDDTTITGGKLWYASETADINDLRSAFMSIDIPSKQTELMNIIQFAQKMMEDSTGVTFLLQGQQGSAPDTVGGMELLHKNASSLLRRVSRIFDEEITEPHIKRYHEWLLIHGEDDEKGDMEIKAVGSTALVEREIQAIQTAQILQMSLNPAFGMSPKSAAEEMLKAWRFQPSRFELTDEEKQALQSQQPPEPPQVKVAQINAQSREKIEQSRMQSSERKMVADMDRDEVYQQTMNQRAIEERNMNIAELQLRRELAMMDYANRNELKLADVKAQLAETAMKLRATKELVEQKASADELPKPPIEPPGQAPAGESYTK